MRESIWNDKSTVTRLLIELKLLWPWKCVFRITNARICQYEWWHWLDQCNAMHASMRYIRHLRQLIKSANTKVNYSFLEWLFINSVLKTAHMTWLSCMNDAKIRFLASSIHIYQNLRCWLFSSHSIKWNCLMCGKTFQISTGTSTDNQLFHGVEFHFVFARGIQITNLYKFSV